MGEGGLRPDFSMRPRAAQPQRRRNCACPYLLLSTYYGGWLSYGQHFGQIKIPRARSISSGLVTKTLWKTLIALANDEEEYAKATNSKNNIANHSFAKSTGFKNHPFGIKGGMRI